VSARADSSTPGVFRSILVMGGGIAGITAAVEAAEAGHEVVIVEKEAYLGGRVAQLAKYFPKLCPPYCGLEINFQRIKRERGIRVYTLAEVERISGEPGNFEVVVRLHPRYVNDRCTTCNACVEVCPVERPNAFNFGMDTTKAIYLPHKMAFPMKYVIDDSVCGLTECGACVDACIYDAIDLEMQPTTLNLHVGAIVVATGWKPYDAGRIDNLGFGKYRNVITNMMLERLAAPNGPTGGRIVRPSDGAEVQSAAFIQCAGSRDYAHLGYCSGICCMASLKEVTYLRESCPDAKAYVFYIDLRTPGPYEAFSKRIRTEHNVTIVKGKVGRITEDAATGQLILDAEDILSAAKMQVRVDLVVLATGMVSSLVDGPIDGPIELDADHFVVTDGTADGICAAGCARAPVDVATAAQDGTAAAMRAMAAVHMAASSTR